MRRSQIGYILRMRIAIIGARLSGSYASLLLSRQGHEVLLFDDSTHKEKPCGGGVTGKALNTIAWFNDLRLPHTKIRTMRMTDHQGDSVDLLLHNPIQIYSRTVLDSSLRDTASRAGTRFLSERAVSFVKQEKGWSIQTSGGTYGADFLIGADGATSSVRSAVAGKFLAADLSLALGFYLPGLYHPTTIVTEFQESAFEGYLWSFPRVDHASVGIFRWLPPTNAAELRRRVTSFIESRYPDAPRDRTFYAARIPSLSRRRLKEQRVCGTDWALLGDAAGFADAITAEGIYYALRSAELLAKALQRGNPLLYEGLWRDDFGHDLLRAAGWRDRFYAGQFLFERFTRRVIQATRLSPTIRRHTDRLIAGQTGHGVFRRDIILRFPQILIEVFCSLLRNHTVQPSRISAEP
jgi:menaquinone-9 beta-reductase